MNYNKLHNYNEVFADNLELNLVYLKKYYQVLDDFIGYTENHSLLQSSQPKAKICKLSDYIRLPEFYEEDIYVDFNDSIDIWKQDGGDDDE